MIQGSGQGLVVDFVFAEEYFAQNQPIDVNHPDDLKSSVYEDLKGPFAVVAYREEHLYNQWSVQGS